MLEHDMLIYLAASESRRAELAGYAAEMRHEGLNICSSWLGEPDVPLRDLAEEQRIEIAERDCREIKEARALVLFTEELPDVVPGALASGGRHWETGFASGLIEMGADKRVVVVGPKQNLFHSRPDVIHYPDWESFRQTWLAALEEATEDD